MMSKFSLILLFASFSVYAGLDEALDLSQFGNIPEAVDELQPLKALALQTGMYHGYVDEYKKINELLERRSSHFEKLYNFRVLLIEGNLIPPVVVKAKNVYENMGDDSFRTVSSIYRIRKPAKVSYNSPNWRDYLMADWELIDMPFLPNELKPKNSKEKNIWKEYVSQGYEKGVAHARNLMSLMLARLNEDFNGMVLAHRLYELNMIEFSTLTSMNKGAVVTAKEININDKVVKLNSNDVFKSPENWKPMIKVLGKADG